MVQSPRATTALRIALFNALPVALVTALLTALPCQAQGDAAFEQVRVFLERNLQDKDAEVKFEVTAGKAGLATLKVVAPDGRTVIDFKAPESKLGLRHITLESPEPTNDGRVQADFPAGTYSFSGRSTTGAKLDGKAMLSHVFPDATGFVRPLPDASAVPHTGLQIVWTAVKGLAAFVVVIEQAQSGRELRVRLAGNATRFAVPAGFLRPGTAYKLAIGSVAHGGNASYIETNFTTGK